MQSEIAVEVIDKPILACTTLYSFGSGIQLKLLMTMTLVFAL